MKNEEIKKKCPSVSQGKLRGLVRLLIDDAERLVLRERLGIVIRLEIG